MKLQKGRLKRNRKDNSRCNLCPLFNDKKVSKKEKADKRSTFLNIFLSALFSSFDRIQDVFVNQDTAAILANDHFFT